MIIYAIIISFNGLKWIDKCLTSISNSTLLLTPIVIDNGSNDGTIEYIKNKYPHVRLIETASNLGFGRANNIGLQLALKENANFVLLLNQDAWLETDTIERLIIALEQNPNYWIVSPLQKHSLTDTLELNFIENLKGSNIELDSQKGLLHDIQFVNASIWLMSRKCIEIVGGFDPLFPHYGEDNDYATRVKFRGGKLGVVSNAIGYHDRDTSTTINIEKEIYRTTLAIVGQLKNINHPLMLNLFIETKRLLQKILKFCFQKDFITLRIYSTGFFKSIVQLNKIRKQRELSKVKGAFLAT